MSKLTSLIKARFESVAHGQKEKQKGASALEYIVLAAVIVIAIGAAAYLFLGGGGDNVVSEKFEAISDCISGDGSDC